MTRAGLPVPGSVVTAEAFHAALDASGVRETLRTRFAALQGDDPQALADGAAQLKALVKQATMPTVVHDAVVAAYHSHARLIGEVKERKGSARKIEGGRRSA